QRLPLLFELFKPYGFSKNVLSDLQEHWRGESGKIFHSPHYELLLDRNDIWLKSKNLVSNTGNLLEIAADSGNFAIGDKQLEMCVVEDTSFRQSENVLQFDFEKLIFRLKMRFWQEVDYFYPLGMGGSDKN